MNDRNLCVTRIGGADIDTILKRKGIGHGLGRLCSVIRDNANVERRLKWGLASHRHAGRLGQKWPGRFVFWLAGL